jgi:large subunit ribosomal protein L28
MVGHNVSHSNIKTKRRFLPALGPATLQSEALGQSFRLRITNAALRTLDFRGGLDVFLLKASDEQLSPRALKIKKQVKAKLAIQAAAA